jgi:hypothetical protein
MTLSKERRYILIGGALLLLLGLVYRFAPTVEGVFGSGEVTALKEQKLANYRRIARKRQALETQLDMLRQTLRRAESGLLSGKTPALAAVEVQNMIKRIVEGKDAQVRSIRVLRPQGGEEGVYVGIPVQATVLSNIRQLKDILYAIESSENLFHVRELRIRAVGRRKQEDRIQSTLTIEGFFKK